MTPLSPAATMQRALSPASAALAFTALLGDRSRLNAALVDKSATIARLEAEWVAAAEADAAAGHARTVRMHDRETWDSATWNRYLTAASKHEPEYAPYPAAAHGNRQHREAHDPPVRADRTCRLERR